MSILIKLITKTFRPEIYSSYLKQKEIRRLPIKEIQEIQWKRLKELLDFVYEYSEFYHDTFKSVNLQPDDINSYEDFARLPIINKKTLKNNYKKVITKKTKTKDYTISHTGGTTGEPFSILIDNKREHPATSAAFLLNRESIGINPFKKMNELMIKSNPINEIKDLSSINKKSFSDRLKYFFFSEIFGIKSLDIKEENIFKIQSIIKDNNIEVLYGFSLNILYLAKLCKMKNINLNIKYVIPIAETLSEQQIKFITDTFNCRLYMDYGASECMRMGFECNQHFGYHMDIYNYYFEYLDDNGKISQPDENTNLIVTNLNNYIFPLIRYWIGDQCILSEKKCNCGNNYPLVSHITGRDSDVIKTPLNDEISLLSIRSELGGLDEYILQYQIIVDQKAKEIFIKIVPTQMYNPELNIRIKEKILKIIKYSMDLKIETVDEIPFDKNGKTKSLIIKS